jgi:NADH-quinone oxidoreductase subunit L
MLVAVIGGLVGIGIAYAKYIKQNQVPDEDAAITGFTKCYTINTMLMKSMTFIREINQWPIKFFRDNVETTLASVVLD